MALKPSFSPLTDALLNGHWDTVHILLDAGADPNQGILRGCLDLTPFHICVEALVNTVRLYNAEAETLLTAAIEQPNPMPNPPPPGPGPGPNLEAATAPNNADDAPGVPPPDTQLHPQLLPFVKRIQRIVSVIVHLKRAGAKEEGDNEVFREVHRLPGKSFSPHADTMGLLRGLMRNGEEGYMGGRFMERHGEAVIFKKFRLDEEGTKIVVVEEAKAQDDAKGRVKDGGKEDGKGESSKGEPSKDGAKGKKKGKESKASK